MTEIVGPFPTVVDAAVIEDYGPVAIATQIFEAENAARGVLVPDSLRAAATGGVHGEHDVVLHRPIVPGEPLRTWVSGHGARPAGRNALVTLLFVTRDADDAVVAEQWWTTVWLGASCDVTGGAPPDHTFPEAARQHRIGEQVVDVDADMARRYAEVGVDRLVVQPQSSGGTEIDDLIEATALLIPTI